MYLKFAPVTKAIHSSSGLILSNIAIAKTTISVSTVHVPNFLQPLLTESTALQEESGVSFVLRTWDQIGQDLYQ